MCAGDTEPATSGLAARTLDEVGPVADVIALEPVDAVHVTTLIDNVSDGLLVDQGPARRVGLFRADPDGRVPRVPASLLEDGSAIDPLRAEHGFSALVSVVRGGRTRHLIFDTGLSPDGMVANMRRLGIDPLDAEAVVLSHGHFDHTTGLDGYLRAVGTPNAPVIIHPEFWSRRRIAIPGREPFEMPSTSRRAMVDAGFAIIEGRRPSFLLGGSVLITGEVDRTTPFEQGFAVHQAYRDDHWAPDPLILDDQALIVHVRDRGLVVLTGCGHAGVVNIVRYAQRLTNVRNVHAIIGGFHLSGALFDPIVGVTCDALAEVAPDVLVPAHCTGLRAVRAIADRLPNAFIQNSVGTRFEFASAATA
jgi:7,8-dihydropterin-6-yl-methyl-4-(beta-D-ribofuranosyl)aminobenzene 5'-phosphate synthase